MTLVLPPHVYLTIIHNQHVDYCMSIGAWLEYELCNGERSGFARDALIKPDDRAAILASGEAWVIDWCPRTSVGSCAVYAATLQRALELANNGEWG